MKIITILNILLNIRIGGVRIVNKAFEAEITDPDEESLLQQAVPT